ncbi:protease HtpX [Ruminiclostridium hungatei]|uniref:Protease HtpX n=1 Tax=Ruminiclostridium hungatei TaxID=48256 RepID=A0A1V4SI08_RUMHU|nr:M48 family metallopeptidase [Ruminiclostridium hungatei]OPX42867.1 protease HtpX [Ruminiclostridium hungatei]
MCKEIRRSILAFSVVFVLFILAVVISEGVNSRHILGTYPERISVAIPDVVSISKPSPEAFEFQTSKVATWLVRLFLSFAVPAFFLFSRLSAGIRAWAVKRTRRWVSMVVVYFSIYSFIEILIYFPVDLYTGFFRMHSYGLSNQTLLQWLVELVKGFLVNTTVTSLVIWVPFLIIKKSPKRWWLYLGLVTIPYLFIGSYVQPVVIDPIFNEYRQVEDVQLSHKIDSLIAKTPIENCQVLQVDKSRETNQMNAFMTGVFNTKRIVLWDTTINYLNNEEVLGVVAHEMGHYLMGHIWKSIVIGGLAGIIALYFVYRLSNWFIRKSNGKWGFTGLHDVAALPLIMLMINLLLFVSAPLSNAYSRSMEIEADRFELELTRNNFATATATVKMHQQSLAMPQPGFVYMLWNYDHPTYKSRVDFANDYRPWESGRPLKYGKFIKGQK